MSDLPHLLHQVRAELACPGCMNTARVWTRTGFDECPTCRGELKNTAAIELLEQLAIRVDQLERIVQP